MIEERDREVEPSNGVQVPLLARNGSGTDRGQVKISLFSLSSLTVILIGAFGMIEYSMVMPSMASYVETLGGSRVFYGVSMGSFSAARLLFMPVLGVWSDKRPMVEALVASILLGIVGNIVYGLAFGVESVWLILIGRMLVGLGAANAAVSMSYITRITETETRTKAIAMLNGINLIGIVVGPATNALVNDIEFKIGSIAVFNHLTNPGWFTAGLLVFLLFLMLATFEEPPSMQQAARQDEYTHVPILQEERLAQVGEEQQAGERLGTRELWLSAERSPSSLVPFDSPMSTISVSDTLQEQLTHSRLSTSRTRAGEVYHVLIGRRLWVHFVVSFCSNFVLSELEVSLPAMTSKYFGWTTLQNSYMYAVIGTLVAVTLIAVMVLSKRIADRSFILFGLVGDILALILACFTLRQEKPSFAMFLVVTMILIGSCPMTGSPNMGLYTKRLQEEEESANRMGLYIGFLQGINGLSRTVAPVYSGFALMDEKDHLAVFLGPLVVVLLSFFILLANFEYFRQKGLV